LQAYRILLSQDQRQEVDQMLREVEELEGQLRQEGTRTVAGSERSRQSSTAGHWWDRVNSWFRRHF
jgi:alpha-glucuronidase